jgi:hypothetical protein
MGSVHYARRMRDRKETVRQVVESFRRNQRFPVVRELADM